MEYLRSEKFREEFSVIILEVLAKYGEMKWGRWKESDENYFQPLFKKSSVFKVQTSFC